MPEDLTIALDAMGGDHGIDSVIPAAVSRIRADDSLRLILVGDESLIQQRLEVLKAAADDRLVVHHATECIGMDESPVDALRGKPDSSMRQGLNLLPEGKAQALVSSGNTGALMALSRAIVRTLPGIDRPAIETTVPSLDGRTHILDLGANVDCRAKRLLQFAVMGSVLARELEGVPEPKVGLLNVGQEAIKGNRQVQEADALLCDSGLNYVGYVEGDDIYCGAVDVVVCDGFVGNVALKTTEGVARMLGSFLRQEFKKGLTARLGLFAAAPVLRRFRRRIDPRRYDGANLLGLRHVVIKSHGGSDAFAFEQAILQAQNAVRRRVPDRIGQHIASLLNSSENEANEP